MQNQEVDRATELNTAVVSNDKVVLHTKGLESKKRSFVLRKKASIHGKAFALSDISNIEDCRVEAMPSPPVGSKAQVVVASELPTSSDEVPVVPLRTDELTALTDPQAEMIVIVASIDDCNWINQYRAIENTRRMIVHHGSVLMQDKHLPTILVQIRNACMNLRSAMSKNALLALAEAIQYIHSALTFTQSLTASIRVLIKLASCEKKFLRDAADAGLEKICIYLPNNLAIEGFLKFSKDRHPRTNCRASEMISKCLINLKTELSLQETKVIIAGLSHFRDGKLPECRNAAKRSFKTIRVVLGPEAFEKIVMEAVSPHIAKVIFKELNTPNAKKKESLRESMRRDRAQVKKDLNIQIVTKSEIITATVVPPLQIETLDTDLPMERISTNRPKSCRGEIHAVTAHHQITHQDGVSAPIHTDNNNSL